MQATRKYPVQRLVRLTVLFFCAFVTAVNAQTRSDGGTPDVSHAKVQQLLSEEAADDEDVIHDIFRFGDKAVPTLVTALRNRKNGENARAVWALVYLAGPKERKILLDAIPGLRRKEMKLFMSSFLAGALVEPASEEEWNFLAACIKRYKDEDQSVVSFSAAIALGENGSQRALDILQAVEPVRQPQGPYSDVVDVIEVIRGASRWITQKSANEPTISTEGKSDLEQVKQIVLENAFYAEGARADLSVEDVIFTGDKSRALASVEIYHGPKNARGYDVVLARHSEKWKIIGIWGTWVA